LQGLHLEGSTAVYLGKLQWLASALQVKEAVEASENLLPTPPIAPAERNKVARGSSAPWRDLKGSATRKRVSNSLWDFFVVSCRFLAIQGWLFSFSCI